MTTATDYCAAAFAALREGVATKHQWAVAASCVASSKALALQGVMPGLREHIAAAELALKAVYLRADQLLGWSPVALEFDELDALSEFADLHELQVDQINERVAA